jgi:nitrite reductase/ring-hydroxylating ferredoxin subunit
MTQVCRSDELSPGQMRSFVVAGRRVLVLRQPDGQLSAMADRCPHRGAPLSGGRLQRAVIADGPGDHRLGEGNVVMCPWHHYRYDANTGVCDLDPRDRVLMYSVTEVDGVVSIERARPARPAAARSAQRETSALETAS